MQRRSRARISAQALAATLLLVSSHSVLAERAGTVEFATGDVSAQAADGATRALIKHGEIRSGDRIVTRNGRAQIRFTDGAFVSLVPDTDFQVRNYRYAGRSDGSETGFFALARGTIRAVSGLIGKANRSRFEIQTPTATLGVRGTAGIIHVAADGTTRMTSTEGVWEMKNAAGTWLCPAGSSGFVTPDPTVPPQRSNAPVIAAPEQPRADRRTLPASAFIPRPTLDLPAGDATDAKGQPSSLAAAPGATPLSPPPPPPASPPPPPTITSAGYTIFNASGGSDMSQLTNVNLTTAGGAPVGVNQMTDLNTALTHVVATVGTTLVDLGNYNTDLYWGRWEGSFTHGSLGAVVLSPGKALHYVAGPMTHPATLPTGTVNFSLLGATSPTINNLQLNPGTFTTSGPMTIDFATGGVGVSFTTNQLSTVSVGDVTVNVNTGPAASSPIRLSGAPGSFQPQFTGTLSAPTAITATSTGAGVTAQMVCTPNCTGQIHGIVTGPNAAAAGFIYEIRSGTSTATITGAAAYRQ